MLNMASFWLELVFGMFDNLLDLLVGAKLFHMMTSALDSVSGTDKLGHLLEYLAASKFICAFTFSSGGIVSPS